MPDRPHPVLGGAIGNKESFLRAVLAREVEGVSTATLRRLAISYGTGYDAVLQLAREDRALGAPLGRDCPISGAEIVHAVRHESAVRLSDALVRRTEAGSAGHPGTDAIERASALMGHAQGWDAQRTRHEIAAVEAFYRLP
jgi:glycerol-3-phosphate dehydrogenase